MTSSIRHLKSGQPRWNQSIQKYKPFRDVFCEKGLFSVIVLACGRPELTKRTVLGTLENIKLYDGEVEFIFIENGNNEENYEFFKSLDLERKVIVRQDNWGINEGLNNGLVLSRGEYIIILENDWKTNIQSNFLAICKDILEEQPLVGMIQLRDPRDLSSNFGLGKPLYNPLTCDIKKCHEVGVVVSKQKTKNNHIYFIMGPYYAFNNNPICITKSLYRKFGAYPEALVGYDNRHGEGLYQEEIYQAGILAAYIGIPIYNHIGDKQTLSL